MNREKRVSKAPERLIEQIGNEPQRVLPARNQVMAAIPVVDNQPPRARRSLNLDLSQVPPSDDPKFSKDFGEYDNKFWQKYFYTPQDHITGMYATVTDNLNDFLPANFRLISRQKEAFGVANLEL